MKQFILSLVLLQLFIAGCNNSSSSDTSKEDSAKSAQRVHDSLTAVQQRQDTLRALGLLNVPLNDSTCALIFSALDSNLIADPRDLVTFIGNYLGCKNKTWNTAHPDAPLVTVMSEDKDNKVLFNILSAKTADDIANVSKAIITVAIAYKTNNPILTSIGTVAGNYTVNSYLEAAKKNDPLIFISPTAIPIKQIGSDALTLTKSGYKALSGIDITKPFTIQLQAAQKTVSIPLIGAVAAKNFVIKNGIATLKNGVKLPVVGNGPLNPTNIKSPVGPLGPLGPVLGKLF